MGKKKFFDKKKSATFQLMARDSSDPNYAEGPSGDRVFIRVDNNPYAPESLNEDESNSIFADADEENDAFGGGYAYEAQTTVLPDNVRKEILELGLPDDGYNYLAHMREIKNTGGGSAYYTNPKAAFEQLPLDVKAYDASKVEVFKRTDVPEEKIIEEKIITSVAAKTVGARLQKVMDPEVAALLDDNDSSRFASDDEDLEEDFVITANMLEEGAAEEEPDEKLGFAASSRIDYSYSGVSNASNVPKTVPGFPSYGSEQFRSRRPLDEQFDMLELQEYGSESEDEYNGSIEEDDKCPETLAEKLKDHPIDLLNQDMKTNDIELPDVDTDVIERVKQYAEKYENENDEEVVFVEESSDESEKWDCESILSTYSTLENHPGKIGAPQSRRQKKLSETVFGDSNTPQSGIIALKGKERLPVDFLPHGKKVVEEKTKDVETERPKKLVGLESKEEKKERKSALKSERREARQIKKEMRGLYKFESQRAQKVAAFTGPSSIHLM